jgi:phytoene dehydrogenase-like protein
VKVVHKSMLRFAPFRALCRRRRALRGPTAAWVSPEDTPETIRVRSDRPGTAQHPPPTTQASGTDHPSPIPELTRSDEPPRRARYDAVVIGGGHNGLVCAAYLAQRSLSVLVLERRHSLGGCSVTEEVVPGFRFSRGSYLAGLLRPRVVEELELESKYGLELLDRSPGSYTPEVNTGRALALGGDADANWRSIAQFSERDADRFAAYEGFIGRARDVIDPLIDVPPVSLTRGPLRTRVRMARAAATAAHAALSPRAVDIGAAPEALAEALGAGHHAEARFLPNLQALLMGSASSMLDAWFESGILKATLATDAVIGAWHSPHESGSAFMLLHHCMSESGWKYARGGMGSVAASIARAARAHGAELRVNAPVREIVRRGPSSSPTSTSSSTSSSTSTSSSSSSTPPSVAGVRLDDGSFVEAGMVIAATSPHEALVELLLPAEGEHGTPSALSVATDHVRSAPYGSGVYKLNLALSALPRFPEVPHCADPGGATIHFANSIDELHRAYTGSGPPLLELTVPSAVDETLCDVPGGAVAQIFCQFADPDLARWSDPAVAAAFEDDAIARVDAACPGFAASVVARDGLSPLGLQQVFNIPAGNFSHFPMRVGDLYGNRPHPLLAGHETPVEGLFLASVGTHPGGGVSGAQGRNCAMVILDRLGA